MKKIFYQLMSLDRLWKRLIQVGFDLIVIFSCFYAAMAARLETFNFLSFPDALIAISLTAPITIIIFFLLGFYSAIIRYISIKFFLVTVQATSLSAFTLLAISQLGDFFVPRSVPIIFFFFLTTIIGLSRFFAKEIFARSQRFENPQTRVAIYGAGETGRQLLRSLESSIEYFPVLFIDDNVSLKNTIVNNLRVRSFKFFKETYEAEKIDSVLVAMPNISEKLKREVVSNLEGYPFKVKILPDMKQIIEGDVRASDFREITIEDLLGREPVPPKEELMSRNIKNRIVLVTGAGGSIGSELCRQIIKLSPKKLIILDLSEFSLFQLHEELKSSIPVDNKKIELIPILCDIKNTERLKRILGSFKVETLFHAAAYKHVPLVESNVVEAIENNIFGTHSLSIAALQTQVKNFILISTDKAVRPTNFMGATKRFAELICQSISKSDSKTKFSMVRFGNVLDSSGSVVPLFKNQIEKGGPITVTHRDITRYFMTIPEAAQLVIQAGAMSRGGDVFVLDMGEPIRILDLAHTMARLHGLKPFERMRSELSNRLPEEISSRAIEIIITGLRPGEKLYEELLIGKNSENTEHPRIMTAHEFYFPKTELEEILRDIKEAAENYDLTKINEIFIKAPIEFSPQNNTSDLIWNSN